VSDVVTFEVASLYTPDPGKDNMPRSFSSHILAAHWRNENFLAAEAGRRWRKGQGEGC
jgi:hypothetical protein